jgi:two-component system response regulator PilR (NtrC family)
MRYLIHVVDDEPIIHDILKRIFEDDKFILEFSTNLEEAIEKHKKKKYDLVLLDLMIPGSSGIQILKEIKKTTPNIKVIIITAYGTLESAVEAMDMGAIDYINKPFDNSELVSIVEKALTSSDKKDINKIKDIIGKTEAFHNIVGNSKSLIEVIDKIKKVARTNSTVLIEGESGTGKELVARAIHMESLRSSSPFVVAYSAPEELFESNLFGHKKGSFTGATSDKIGLIEIAHGGTLFFDDIATVSLTTQAKLLRVIQEKEYIVVGGTKVRKADVRVIAATNQNLKQMVEQGKFREDLYYRLNVIKITLPPLRNRKEDIPLLADYFIKKYSEINSKIIETIDKTALELLTNYKWPGNIRELEHLIESMVVLSDEKVLTLKDIPAEIKVGEEPDISNILELDGTPLKEKIEELKRYLIIKALNKTGGVQNKAAKILGLKPTTLSEIIKRFEKEREK